MLNRFSVFKDAVFIDNLYIISYSLTIEICLCNLKLLINTPATFKIHPVFAEVFIFLQKILLDNPSERQFYFYKLGSILNVKPDNSVPRVINSAINSFVRWLQCATIS